MKQRFEMQVWSSSVLAGLFVLTGVSCVQQESTADDDEEVIAESGQALGAYDPEAGMTNTMGLATRLRAAVHLARPNAKVYNLAHPISERMPQSPFSAPLSQEFSPTFSIPGIVHAVNSDSVCGDIGGQGTQMDGLGHFGYLDETHGAIYYNGYTQQQVKPAPDSPLLKLSVDKYKPIITTAILLDARKWNGGQPLVAGQVITPADIEEMRQQQHIRPFLRGDALLIYTGWSDHWNYDAPDPMQTLYYSQGPGLSVDVPEFLAGKEVAFVALDNPFTDAVVPGHAIFPPYAEGYPNDEPYPNHGRNLAIHGIAQGQNFNLKELADDEVYLSAFFLWPLPIKGGGSSPVTPIAVGAP